MRVEPSAPSPRRATPIWVSHQSLTAAVRGVLALGVLLLCAAAPIAAQCEFTEDQKFIPADSAPGDIYAGAVGISGDWMFIMSEWDDINGVDSGSAYIYNWNGSSWVETQKIDPNDGAAGDNFGRSVAVQGSTAVIGAHWDNTVGGFRAGSAYIYTFNGSIWVQSQKLVPPDASPISAFGNACWIDGDVMAIAAWRNDVVGNESGAVYTWRFNGTDWAYEEKIVPSDAANMDQFGRGVWVSGDVMVVGAYRNDDDGTDSGCAYVFRFNGTTWVEEQKLRASDASANDRLGHSVSIDGDVILAGAHLEDTAGVDAGAAYFFRYNGSTWVEEQKVIVSGAAPGDRAGLAVAVQGDTALISAHRDFGAPTQAPGAVYVFRDLNGVWTEEQKLIASDGVDGDVLGFHVALDGDYAVGGAWRANNNSGTGYVYNIARNDFNNDDIPDECQSFWVDLDTVSLLAGGVQNMTLDAGAAHANSFYRVLGTFTGTSPGIGLPTGEILPLNFDAYFRLTLRSPGLSPFFGGFKGNLSPTGTGVASFTVPVASDPTLAGVIFHHAFVAAQILGDTDFVSVPMPLMLVP